MSNAQLAGAVSADQMQARRFDESSLVFGPAVSIGPPETGYENDLAQAQTGGSAAGHLYAVWRLNGHPAHLRFSTSSDGGASWATPSDIVREEDLFHLRVDVAPDGQGFVVWDQNSNSGQVRAAPLVPIQAAVKDPAAGLTPSQVIKLPSAKRCRSRREFKIRLVVPAGVQITTATVRVNGKRVKVVHARRLTSQVNLKGLPKGRYTVKITVVTASGKSFASSRHYRTCIPRRR
jgi:hypothetical protein